MNLFTIRPALPNDLPFLRDMLYESIFTPEGAQPPNRDIIDRPSLSKYVDGWGKTGDIGFIALSNQNQPVGSVTLRFFTAASKGYGFVDEITPELGMAVLRKYRGQGIGTALLRAVLEEANQRGIKAISLSVDPRNPAKRLYERFCFKDVGKEGGSVTMKLDL